MGIKASLCLLPNFSVLIMRIWVLYIVVPLNQSKMLISLPTVSFTFVCYGVRHMAWIYMGFLFTIFQMFPSREYCNIERSPRLFCCRLTGSTSQQTIFFGAPKFKTVTRSRTTIIYCTYTSINVADPGFLSRILIFSLPISDPGSKNSNKERGEKKLVVIPFFVAINFTKFKFILFL